ncbi:MAG: hypothetical protein RL701_5941, partial [Pseudomonadota bacterium]
MPIAAYGTWLSPLPAELLARGSVRYGFTLWTPEHGLLWSEQRSAEQGRVVIVQLRENGECVDLLPAPYSARTRVHEYGGRSFCAAGELLWFVNQSDQQIYVRQPDGAIRQLTAVADTRFAEPVHDARRARLLAIAERHEPSGAVVNYIASIDLTSGAVAALASGHDFFASPALCPNGDELAYLVWDHPHMPWDAAELHWAHLTVAGSVARSEHVAGGPGQSALQPTWSPDAQLYFALEVDDTWALQRAAAGRSAPTQPLAAEPVAAVSGEVGAPLWQLGTQLWGFVAADTILAVAFEQGRSRLVHVDIASGQSRVLSDEFPYIGQLTLAANTCYLSIGWTGSASEIVRFTPATTESTCIRSAHAGLLADADCAQPEAVSFPTSHDESAHGFFYAPKNQHFAAPANTQPPLIVLVHGGPTAGTAATFNPTIQYFTTRGFAVLDVNYRGSTGYGRAYRDRLRGTWGLLDVDDCVAGARYLAESGRVDPAKLVIRGGSAGGYTVLQALANHDVFALGSCHYGVSDLEALTRDTHKFESHYDRFLIGPYPERRDLFVARSPIHYVEKIRRPVIFFQGLEDRVVPADQTERMANVLREHGIETEYHAYAGEQHGFRKADTIEHVLHSELAFLQRVLGL